MFKNNPTCNCDQCDLKELFSGNVTDNVLQEVCNMKYERSFKKGEIIINEGTDIKEFIYLKSGLVKLYRKGLYAEEIICFARPLDFVSLLSIFSEKKYNYSVSALEDSVTCNLDFIKVKEYAQKNGGFALSLMEKMSRASDKIILTTLEIRQRRLYGRVAYFLLFFSNEVYKAKSFELPISRKEIADFFGMTAENIIRTLSEFRKDGIIKLSGKSIEIINEDKLKVISSKN